MDVPVCQAEPAANLAGLLSRVRGTWVRAAAYTAAARALAAIATTLALAAVVERAFPLSDTAALALAAAAAAACAAALACFLAPLRRRAGDRQVARLVEERYPGCGDEIATAVHIAAQPSLSTGAFAPLIVASAVRTMAALDLNQVVDPRGRRLAAWRAAGSAAACALALVAAAPLLERGLQAGYVRLRPASVSVAVRPGDMRVAAGRPAVIRAVVRGMAGGLDRIAPRITLDAGGSPVTLPMERTADGYRFTVPSVERSFQYLVTAGPAASPAYSVTALHPSRVRAIDLQYDFPAFTGLKPRLDRDSGDVYGPAGTRVRVVVHVDKPVRDGALGFADGRRAALTRVDDRTLAASLTLAEEGSYRVGLVDADGLTSESVEYFVRVMDDRPPEVHILRPGGDEPITPLQEVPIEARANDDFGVARMDLVYSVAGGPETAVPFTALSGTGLARVGGRILAAEDLKVKPGDVIAYYARAWDVPRAKRSTMARSEIFFLEVQPFNEEYAVAQSRASIQGADATELDGLIAAQKEIISATWNLERRAAAGRSPADAKGVADAQAELKGRAERAAGQQQRRRVGAQPPQRRLASGQRPAAGPDPVLNAADAMGRAIEALQRQQTSGAIPHEMAALNALLQAQAEIRRRQVSQEQGSGAGGFGNRQTQDLSTLFDRELKRQQKTNYENRTQAEAPTGGAAAQSALDRIRDLARRQEELTRQQRDLSTSSLPAEEMKRRLETLAREQEQIRRQAEDAARQTDQQGRGGGAQPDVKNALQHMQAAAAESQKGDASGAAGDGQQAADALRRAESRLENGSPDAQKRALGDLQLESQQVAQAQQRIADEAARLDREGGGTSDARRRLAGEKDHLADRVGALQRSAQRQAAAVAAAQDMASQQLDRRMRATAQQLRDQTTAGGAAAAEQQMADALARVARRIGANDAGGATADGNGDAKRLGGQLDDVRDARDRIARLDRSMREAQRKASPPGAAGTRGPEGRQGQGGSRGDGQGGDVSRLQQQMNEELQRTRELLDRLQHATPDAGGRMTTPEQHEWSRSAPGTEAFKQDYAAWQSLAADVARALERVESAAASRLSVSLARDRLRAGGSERVPDAYLRQVSRYFEAIAVKNAPREPR